MAVGNADTLRRQVKAVWTRHQASMVVLAITLLAAGLRLYDIDANGLNHDETYTIWLAQHDSAFILRFTTFAGQDAISPPLHYMLARALLLIGGQPQVIRLLSVLAGTLMVWLTFRLAAYLFDLRVAILSALLMAIAPLHIAYSRVGRPHILSSLLALLSLCFFARILFSEARRGHWVGLVVTTAAACWTFVTVFLLVLFENACVLILWLRHRLSRQLFVRWIVSQVVLVLLVLPVVLSALIMASSGKIDWLTRPGLQSLVRSAIFFGTGDPSYGSTGVTPARALSLATIMGAAVLGGWTFLQRGYHRRLDGEGRRVLFLGGALVVPWVAALVISQVRPVYKERYLLYLMPPLFILFAWIFTRARPVIVSMLVLLVLTSLTGSALFVYYTEPFTEQWREAVALLRPNLESKDLIIISPGFYDKPFSYYFCEGFPKDAETLEGARSIVVENGSFRAFSLLVQVEGVRVDDPALATAQRIWLVSGYAPVDPAVLRWIEQDFEALESADFVGVGVRLLERIQDYNEQVTAP